MFQPAPLAPDTFDWIQLTSDEWLKGELIALYDGRLEFDSEELENLTFDWDDIRELRTGRVVQVRFKNRTQLTAKIACRREDRPRARGHRAAVRSSRTRLLRGNPGNPATGQATSNFGFTLRRGNSDQVEANTVTSARRRTVTTRVVRDYVGN